MFNSLIWDPDVSYRSLVVSDGGFVGMLWFNGDLVALMDFFDVHVGYDFAFQVGSKEYRQATMYAKLIV